MKRTKFFTKRTQETGSGLFSLLITFCDKGEIEYYDYFFLFWYYYSKQSEIHNFLIESSIKRCESRSELIMEERLLRSCYP